jgi:hypothetical protein
MTDESDAELPGPDTQPGLRWRRTCRSEIRSSKVREVSRDAEIRVDPRALGEEPSRLCR